MATIISENELVRRAIIYLDQRRQEKTTATRSELLDEAAMRFNLGPADAADLCRLFQDLLEKDKSI